MLKIIVHGYQGTMGQNLCKSISKDKELEIVAGIDTRKASGPVPFPTFTEINECNMPADVIIDFSVASAIPSLIDYSVKRKLPVVICTTALSSDTLTKIEVAKKEIPIFKSANMSLGINIMANLLNKISNIMYEEGFDIEIIEKHHNLKIDAPSGTAYLLGNAIKDSVDENMEYVFNRSNSMKKRDRNEIGMHAVRGGTIVGEHEVLFAGTDEILKITHTAYSKELFVTGALKASKYISNKPAGVYSMQDLMSDILK